MKRDRDEMGRHEQARWWLRTAEGDLAAARLLAGHGRHNLAAFHAQQAAEKALKAVLADHGDEVRTHSATEVLDRLRAAGAAPPESLDTPARRLDLHYIQSRYPNGLGGDPTVYHDAELADESVELADRFLNPDFSYLRCEILEEGVPIHDRGAFAEARRRYEERKATGEIVFREGRVIFPES